MLSDDTEHALARLRAAIEGSKENGWLDCQISVCRYLRKRAENLPPEMGIQILRIAAEIGDGMHREAG